MIPHHVRNILHVDPILIDGSKPFYIRDLSIGGVDALMLDVEEFFLVDAELARLCGAIESAVGHQQQTLAIENLLTAYPMRHLSLLTIGEQAHDISVALGALLALRELADSIISRLPDSELRREDAFRLGVAGIPRLMEVMIVLHLDASLLGIINRIVRPLPLLKDLMGFNLLHHVALYDVGRKQVDPKKTLYELIRSTMIYAVQEDANSLRSILLADFVHAYCEDQEISERVRALEKRLDLTSNIDELRSEIDLYVKRAPKVAVLFDTFISSTARPLLGDPRKDLRRLIARENITTVEEMSAFVEQFKSRPIPTIPHDELTENERAEDDVDAVQQIPLEDRRSVLTALTEQYPTSMWPWVGLVDSASTSAEVLAFAEQGLLRADELAIEQQFNAYTSLLLSQARALVDDGNYADAIERYEFILEIDANDPFVVRDGLLALLLRRGLRHHLDRAEVLIKKMNETNTRRYPALPWLTLLLSIIRKRSQSVIDTDAANAMTVLPHIGLSITGLQASLCAYNIPPLRDEDEEATFVAMTLCRLAWSGHPDATKQLKKLLKEKGGR